MRNEDDIKWLDVPEEHNYPAAESYLGLVFDDAEVISLVAALRQTTVRSFKAKDIFRASSLSLLGISNQRVERDRKKIRDGEHLSPILLVRDRAHGKVVIADGYHRLCAVYSYKEDALVPCKIVSLQG